MRQLPAAPIEGEDEADAIRLAVAAAHGLDMVISWNFEHMLNTRTRRQVNAINDLKGFPRIEKESARMAEVHAWREVFS